MRVIIVKDYEEMSRRAVKTLSDRLRRKPDLTLGLATGSTPIGMYKELIKAHKEKGLDFSRVRSFNVDEEAAKNLKWRNYYKHAERMVEKLESEEK